MTHDPGCRAYLFVNGGHLRHAGVELAGRLESQRFPGPFLSSSLFEKTPESQRGGLLGSRPVAHDGIQNVSPVDSTNSKIHKRACDTPT